MGHSISTGCGEDGESVEWMVARDVVIWSIQYSYFYIAPVIFIPSLALPANQIELLLTYNYMNKSISLCLYMLIYNIALILPNAIYCSL